MSNILTLSLQSKKKKIINFHFRYFIKHDSSSNKLVTSVYKKPTCTRLLMNNNSFTSSNYRKGLTKTLIYRTFCVSSTWFGIHYDILNLKSVLQKNKFPLKVIGKNIFIYLTDNVFKKKKERK